MGFKITIIAGEPSGDQLGGKLMGALKSAHGDDVSINGMGGEAMIAQGLEPPFPLSEIAVMGPVAILKRLPSLRRRVLQMVDYVLLASPDVLVIIDSPEFTQRVASRVRAKRPDIPIVNYVSPTVWAWRPGRAKKMVPHVDHILALLPFEPDAHRRLGGPKCSYVGHPLVEKFDWIDDIVGADLRKSLTLENDLPVVVVLPGSRRTEVGLLMAPFGRSLDLVEKQIGAFETVIPVVPAMKSLVEEKVSSWGRNVHFVEGDEAKFQAFRLAKAALASSGTVTLELAVSGTPMVVAYRVERLAYWVLRYMIKAPSAVLANLILGRNAFPEFLQNDCVPEKLAGALAPLLEGGEERDRQLEALAEIRERMVVEEGSPSNRAAHIVMQYAKSGRNAYPA